VSGPGLLFDLDGTLVHTDPVHFRAFNAMLATQGQSIDLDGYLTHIIGRSNPAIMAGLFPDLPVSEHRRLADLKEATFRSLALDLRPLRGLVALLDAADAADLPWGVVTNAPRANAEHLLAALGLRERTRVLVIGEELSRAKPDPLPYQTGLALIGADAVSSVAFEDSASGVRSAAAAGLAVAGLTTSLPAGTLMEAGASLCASDFADQALLSLIAAVTGLTAR
jgi:beta-phosphoglucomutase